MSQRVVFKHELLATAGARTRLHLGPRPIVRLIARQHHRVLAWIEADFVPPGAMGHRSLICIEAGQPISGAAEFAGAVVDGPWAWLFFWGD